MLSALLNVLVSQDGAMPAAGDLGCADWVESDAASTPSLRRLFLDGMSSVVDYGDAENAHGFLALDTEAQTRVLAHIEAVKPLFFSKLVELAYQAYYTDSRVHQALGYDGSPPHPRGYQLPQFDPAILDVQRRRLPLWRATDTMKPGAAPSE